MMGSVVAMLILSSVFALDAQWTDPARYSPGCVMRRDVAIVGGGSSGVYAAFRLRDNNRSVVVLEKKGRLGGHAEVYTDPRTGREFNMGVQVFEDIQIVRDYFGRFNVPLVSLNIAQQEAAYVDFSTGKLVKNGSLEDTGGVEAAFGRYVKQLSKYPSLQHGFNTRYPVQPDLLLPFGQFSAKYDLGSFVNTVTTVLQGFAALLDIPMLYMFKAVSSLLVQAFQKGFLTTPDHNTGRLYDAAAVELGVDVLFNSSILAMDRSSCSDVKILVQTAQGEVKLILARQLVSAIPPVPQVMRGFDLDGDELDLFGRFFGGGYYSLVLKNTGLASGTRYQNYDSTQPYGFPREPHGYAFSPDPLGLGYTQVLYASVGSLTEELVRANVLADLARVKGAIGSNVNQTGLVEVVAFVDHAPFNLMVSKEDIEGGFYERLYGLQGRRGTWYAGAAWMTADSSVIWAWVDEYLLPNILEALVG